MTPQTLEQMDMSPELETLVLNASVAHGNRTEPAWVYDLEVAKLVIKHERERVKLSEEERGYVECVRPYCTEKNNLRSANLLAIIDRITGMEAGK